MKKLYILTFFAIATFFLLVSTYAVFESTTSRDALIKLALFEVEVNDDIVTSESRTFKIEDIIWNTNENVLNGKVAPGMDGYFDIAINPKMTEVAIKYEIIYDKEYLDDVNPYIVIDEIVELSGYNLIQTDVSTYTGVISLEDFKKHIIRVHVNWLDETSNNEADYLTGSTMTEFEIPINVIISQYLGEEIIEYKGD